MNIDFSQPQNIISLVSIAIALIAVIFVIVLKIKLKKVFMDDTSNISESLTESKQRLLRLEKFQKDTAEYLEGLEKRVSRSVQSTEIIRFSPFSGIGRNGNQSFSASFINEEGDGMVLSGLYYSNDRVSLFVKPTKGFTSEFELTPEENEVVLKAKKRLNEAINKEK